MNWQKVLAGADALNCHQFKSDKRCGHGMWPQQFFLSLDRILPFPIPDGNHSYAGLLMQCSLPLAALQRLLSCEAWTIVAHILR